MNNKCSQPNCWSFFCFFVWSKNKVKMWVNHSQSWSKFQTMVEKYLILTWKDENFHLGKKFDLVWLSVYLVKNGNLVILTMNMKNEIIHHPIGMNSIVLKNSHSPIIKKVIFAILWKMRFWYTNWANKILHQRHESSKPWASSADSRSCNLSLVPSRSYNSSSSSLI